MDTQLTELLLDLGKTEGACATGICTTETLAGGPPSTDLTYVQPEAKSAISFAIPENQDFIPPFLKKQDHNPRQRDHLQTTIYSTGLAGQIAAYLEMRGFRAVPIVANAVYRTDTEGGLLDMMPQISLRYLAARSGVGFFGQSGNILTKDYGAAVVLGGVVTEAELVPTDPIPAEDQYCDDCQLCRASCASDLMDRDEDVTVMLGDYEFTYSKRRTYDRCNLVCGGFTGLHRSGKWSTWSPGRFEIPEEEDDFREAVMTGAQAWMQRPEIPGGTHHPLLPMKKLNMTCGNCSIICHPDRDERKRRYKMLTSSGVVVQREDGTLEALSPVGAKERLAAMPRERRALYEIVPD